MRSKIVAAAITASMLGGAGAGIAFFSPGLVSAQTDSSTSTTQAQTGDTAGEPRPLPPWLTDALKKLVDANTINQSQSDAVAQALTEAQPAKGPGGHGGPGGRHGGPGRGPRHGIAAAATALGMSEADLHTALRSGKSIADVAEEKNVDLQKVIDAMVDEATKKIDEAVAAGRLTQAQADEKKAGLVERITEHVNKTRPAAPAPDA